MRYLVAVHGSQGQTVSLEELFSRISARWMWVEKIPTTVAKNALPTDEENGKIGTIGMCVMEGRSLSDLSAELAKMPGGGIIKVEIHPLVAQESGEEAADTTRSPGTLTKEAWKGTP
jgi:hypothetical protein